MAAVQLIAWFFRPTIWNSFKVFYLFYFILSRYRITFSCIRIFPWKMNNTLFIFLKAIVGINLKVNWYIFGWRVISWKGVVRLNRVLLQHYCPTFLPFCLWSHTRYWKRNIFDFEWTSIFAMNITFMFKSR